MSIYIKKLCLSFFLVSLYCVNCYALVSPTPEGSYVFSQQGEQLIDGSNASITWRFIFNQDKHTAEVKISSWHAPYTCQGEYFYEKKGNELNLIWNAKKSPEEECETPAPQFIIKHDDKDRLLIKSKLFPWTVNDWEQLKEINHGNSIHS